MRDLVLTSVRPTGPHGAVLDSMLMGGVRTFEQLNLVFIRDLNMRLEAHMHALRISRYISVGAERPPLSS